LTPQQRATLEHTTEALRKSHDAFLQQHHTRMTRLLASLDEDSDVHALLARCGKDDVAARGAQTPDEAIHAYLCSAEFMVVGGLGMLAAIPGER
jgi:rhamnose utilization protein RhaD (predicted bifunctional aldolase and dehydrogenase)